jgi:uncharacterized protein (TIGR02678 family)
MSAASSRLLEAAEERREAMRALLATPFVTAADPAFRLIRHHESELARTAADLFGYRLEMGATAARLSGPPTRAGLRRPLRIRPGSVSGRARPVDEWPALSDRAAVLLFLTLAALERSAAQVAIADLARAVARAGADADPPIAVDCDARHERVAFADGVDLLVAWGVLEHTAGTHESYRRRAQDEDEALLTIDRRRLALVLRDPSRAASAATLEDVLAERRTYAESADGRRRARAHELARRLAEDPVLLLVDLEDEDRAYFTGQRARLEHGVGAATGMAVERRAEGSALIVEGRSLTDLPFPTNATLKQLALLLCDTLAAVPDGTELDELALRDAVAELLRLHEQHWRRDPRDREQVARATADVTALLCDLGLASATAAGGLRPLAACARYRAPTVRRPLEDL